MENIYVDEYIRTEKGISKLIDIEFIDDSAGIFFKTDKDDIINQWNITKHSFNLIDLIEVGDYVNGELIDFVVKDKEDKDDKDGRTNFIIRDNILFFNKYNRITSIVTKEAFASVEYKVGGENE